MRHFLVYCIVVTYNPDPNKLAQVIDSIGRNSCNVIIVDNTADGEKDKLCSNFHTIYLGRNYGIAFAQNAGIKEALKNNAEFIWLSDQDTIYPDDYLDRMLSTYRQLTASTEKISSLCPVYFDSNRNQVQPFIRQNPFTERFTPAPGVNEISHAIASGMLIPAEALKVCGLMQENLFIDWVDLEWCWRCSKIFGYKNFGTGDVVIRHTLGDGLANFFHKKISFHNSIRHYYIVRNAIHLALYSKSPAWPVRFEVFCKAIAWTLIFPAIAPNDKIKHLAATSQGLIHGIFNRMGPRPS